MELGCVVFLLAFVLPTLGAHDLASKYTYRRVLNDDADGSYVLHWRFDISEETIYFAVNVSTTGWVGFGISPNGRMPGSDVVIGWVESDGTARFSVSYCLRKFSNVVHGGFTCYLYLYLLSYYMDRIALLMRMICHLLIAARTGNCLVQRKKMASQFSSL